MKKVYALMLALCLAVCGFSALAEGADAQDLSVNTLIEDGSFIIQLDVDENDDGWRASDMAQDESVVKLYDADILENTFVARYDPVGDGDVTVGIYHYINDFACDQAMTWDLHVEGGAVREVLGGSHTASPDEAEQSPVLVGEWQEKDTQFTSMTITKNPELGWDVEIAAPLTHGAYLFRATVYYDCELDQFVYADGCYWDVPITDGEAEVELGEPKVQGTNGCLTLAGSEAAPELTWYDDQTPEQTVAFEKVG